MEVSVPKTSAVMCSLLRADFIALYHNRRAAILVLVVPMIVVFSWQGLIATVGGAFVLANSITLGLVAIGLMSYTNSIARDRDKGVFQRLRVSPIPSWTIMASRLILQLTVILIMTFFVFLSASAFDGIVMPTSSYILTLLASIVGGTVYLALGQIIVGRIQNPETVNSTSRLIYFVFIMAAMFGELGVLGDKFKTAIDCTPYGTVKDLLAASLNPSKWSSHTNLALLLTIGYATVFATIGIKWFKWNAK